MDQRKFVLLIMLFALTFALPLHAQTEDERDSIAYERCLKEKLREDRKRFVREWEFKKTRAGWTFGPEYNFVLPFILEKGGYREYDCHNALSICAGYRFNELFYLGVSLGVMINTYSYYISWRPDLPAYWQPSLIRVCDVLIPLSVCPRLYLARGRWCPFVQLDPCVAFYTYGDCYFMPTVPLGVEYNVKGKQTLIMALCPGMRTLDFHFRGDFILGLKVGYMF